jgi:nitrogen regulatory protein PII
MQLHKKKRIEIIIERPILRRMTDALDTSGVRGYTILPAHGGSGQDGAWERDGLVSAAGAMVAIICILDATNLEPVLDAIYAVVERQIGIVSVSDVEVIRSDHF